MAPAWGSMGHRGKVRMWFLETSNPRKSQESTSSWVTIACVCNLLNNIEHYQRNERRQRQRKREWRKCGHDIEAGSVVSGWIPALARGRGHQGWPTRFSGFPLLQGHKVVWSVWKENDLHTVSKQMIVDGKPLIDTDIQHTVKDIVPIITGSLLIISVCHWQLMKVKNIQLIKISKRRMANFSKLVIYTGDDI